MDIAKTDRYIRIYNVYKDLLTTKQRDIFELYFYNNLSLAEIAEDQNVSRHAPQRRLDSAMQSLNHYEDALKFADKIAEIEEIISGKQDAHLDHIARILGINTDK